MQFAFKTGIWNGVICEVKGLPDAGILATEYFLSPEKARAFDEGLSQLTFASAWASFKEAHGYEENKETNDFKLSHQFGKDIVFVASFFVGVGEVAALAKTAKFAKVSTLTKISKGISDGIIKVLKKMPQHLSGALKKLPDNIVKEVQRAGTKSYLILKLNTTRLAKISDDALFSEMKLLQEGAVIKLTDGSDAIFENIRYLDDLGEKTGTITIVKNGDELGFKIVSNGVDDLANYVNRLISKNIINAIIDLAESRTVAQKYFNRIKQNPSNYLSDYTFYLDDFDSWYRNVFKSNLFEAHHIIPKNILRDNINLQSILDWARKNNKTWDFGDIDNGIMLQKRRKNSLGEVVGDHANHPQYDLQIDQKINNIFNENTGNMPDAFDDLVDFVNELKIQLNTNVVEASQIVNSITIP